MSFLALCTRFENSNSITAKQAERINAYEKKNFFAASSKVWLNKLDLKCAYNAI